MANTNATEFRNILIDMPDFPGTEVEFWLLTRFAANGTEAFPKRKYVLTLDANGQGTQALPVPSSDAWLWRVVTPDGKPPYNPTLAAGADLQLTTWLASAQSTVTAASLADQFAGLANFDAHVADTTAVHGIADTSLLETTAGAQAKADAAEAAGAASGQAGAIAALGGADGTVTDEQLRNWAGQARELLTSVTRTDYSKSWIGTDGETLYAGYIAVTGAVTWPDGVTGHLDGVEYPEQPGVLQYFTASHVASGKIVFQDPLVDGVAGVTVVTPDYYVDSAAAGGGDGTIASPLNSVATLPALSPGDVVALKSGSTWLEDFDFGDGVAVSVYRYGAGAKPALDARETIAAGAWTLYGAGAGSTYQAVITWDGGVGVENVGAWADGLRATHGSSATGLNAGQYFIADHTTGSGTIYFRASDDGDLSAGAHTIKYAARYGGLGSDMGTGVQIDGCTFDGIQCIGNTSPSGSITGGRNTIIRNCSADEGSKHNIYYSSGSQLFNASCVNAYNGAQSGVMFIGNDTDGDDLGLHLQDCYASQDTYNAPISGFGFHAGASGNSFGPVNHVRCVGRNLGYLVSNTSDCTTANFLDTVADECLFGLTFSEVGATYNINRFYFVANRANMIPIPMSTNGLIVNVDNMYYKTDTGTLTTGVINIGNATPSLTLKRSTFVFNNASGNRRGIDCRNAGASITMTQCRHGGSATGQIFPFYFTVNPTYISDWNIFQRADLNFYINSVLYSTVAAYKTATNKDLLSIVAAI